MYVYIYIYLHVRCGHRNLRLNKSKHEIEESWPTFDENLIAADSFELVVQINGKVRGKIEISSSLEQNEIESVAKSIKNVDDLLGDKEIKKCIYVKEKLINFVI